MVTLPWPRCLCIPGALLLGDFRVSRHTGPDRGQIYSTGELPGPQPGARHGRLAWEHLVARSSRVWLWQQLNQNMDVGGVCWFHGTRLLVSLKVNLTNCQATPEGRGVLYSGSGVVPISGILCLGCCFHKQAPDNCQRAYGWIFHHHIFTDARFTFTSDFLAVSGISW